MKTPDEIKKGLECYFRIENFLCGPQCIGRECELYTGNYSFTDNVKDALVYIKQLEAELAQVTRERDAAVEELSYSRKCSICKKHLSEGGDCYGNHKCGNGNPDWQWRGVEKEVEG